MQYSLVTSTSGSLHPMQTKLTKVKPPIVGLLPDVTCLVLLISVLAGQTLQNSALLEYPRKILCNMLCLLDMH